MWAFNSGIFLGLTSHLWHFRSALSQVFACSLLGRTNNPWNTRPRKCIKEERLWIWKLPHILISKSMYYVLYCSDGLRIVGIRTNRVAENQWTNSAMRLSLKKGCLKAEQINCFHSPLVKNHNSRVPSSKWISIKHESCYSNIIPLSSACRWLVQDWEKSQLWNCSNAFWSSYTANQNP